MEYLFDKHIFTVYLVETVYILCIVSNMNVCVIFNYQRHFKSLCATTYVTASNVPMRETPQINKYVPNVNLKLFSGAFAYFVKCITA